MQANKKAASFSTGTVFFEKRYIIFCEKFKILKKVQTFSRASQKKKKTKNHKCHKLSWYIFVFKQDLILAKNKAATYTIKLFMLE